MIAPAGRRSIFVGARKELGILVLLLVLCGVVAALNHSFVSVTNLQDVARLVGIFGIFSIGMGVAIITGGIDLSAGSMFALEGVLLVDMLTVWHWPAAVAVIASIGFCALLGWIHGFLITRVPLQPFIVTLCALLIYRGAAEVITGESTVGFGDGKGFEWLTNFATGSLFGIPASFSIMIVVSAVMWVVLHRSVFGRHLLAVGRNEEAARYAGIDSRRVIASAYVISGLLAGISGILFAFYTNSITPSVHGQSYELYGIAAAVVGGCSLRGGEGTVIGIIIGAALLRVLQNLVNMLGIPSSFNFAIMGAVILFGVIIDELVKRRAARVK
ncbi:MAG: ABC transporter permease [Capsulimonadaceae bacterium]